MRQCTLCSEKHMAKGLCKKHYLEQYRNEPRHKEVAKVKKAAWFQENKDLEKLKLRREQANFDGKREEVIERDGYTCQVCGATKRLVVHHKDGKGRGSFMPNNEPSNLVTLCKACHMDAHRTDMVTVKRLRKNGYWARDYERCRSCGRSDIRHGSFGLCVNCYARYKRNR